MAKRYEQIDGFMSQEWSSWFWEIMELVVVVIDMS